MPLTLHHGPAGPQKQGALHQLLSTQSIESIGSTKDWYNFLLHLTANTSQPIDSNTALALLASITPKATKELVNLFIQLKMCGIGVKEAQKILPDQSELPILQLFDAYEKALADRNLFDAGSLTLHTINLLKNRKTKIDKRFKTIIIAGLYPLHIGQREILRFLTQMYPDLTIHVFYDESFEQKNESLERAYLDLGQMASSTIHYDAPTREHTVHEFKTPIHETRFVVSEIQKKISESIKPEDVAIILLDKEERIPLERALLTANVPYTLDMELPLTDILPQFAIISTQHPNNVFLQRKAQAQQYVHDCPLLSTMSTTVQQFIFPQLTFNPPIQPNAVIMTTLDRARTYMDKHIFIIGLNLEHLATETEEVYGARAWAAKGELAELFKTPSYRMHVAFGLLDQLLGYSKNVFLTRAEMDRASRPLMRVGGQRWHYTQTPAAESPPHHNSHYSHHSQATYTPQHPPSLSVSALQEYLDCPYSFYAKYVLKAESYKEPALEPDGKIRGSFVHDVLKRLFYAYGSQIVQPEASASIQKNLPELIEKMAAADANLKVFPPAVIKEFTNRVSHTLSALITRESREFSLGTKQTIPKFCEWDFGKSNERRFEVPTAEGLLSITGRIDRIDVNEKNKQFSVVDFKTGSLPTLDEILSGQSLQLPLYLMAVQKIIFPEFTPSAALYYGLKTNRVFGFTLKGSCDEKILTKRNTIDPKAWQEVQKQTIVHCVHTVHNVHQGHFEPQPYDTNKCKVCDYRRICGFKQ